MTADHLPTLGELALEVRSKNAGPFWVTMELFMRDAEGYALVAKADETGTSPGKEVLADLLGVSVKTIARHSQALEEEGALIRIPLSGGVYAYALHPEEIWRSWDSGKDYAAFYSKTLVNKKAAGGEHIRRRLQVMIKERSGEPELPLEPQA